MKRENISVFKAQGSWYDIGRAHGSKYAQEIREYAEKRIALVTSGKWTANRSVSRQEILTLAKACIEPHATYSPELFDELKGLHDTTDLSMAELIIVGGYTDFVDAVYAHYGRTTPLEPYLTIDDCTAFIIPDHRADGAGFFGQTWDMDASAADYVMMLHIEPDDAPAAQIFTTTGCLGQIGMNEHGIAVGINNLLGNDGQIGVTWPTVVRKILMQDNLDDALACITDAPLAGAHNYLLFDRTGAGYNVEAMPSYQAVTPLADEPIIHTNHCLIPEANARAQVRIPESQHWSESRLTHAVDAILDQERIEVEDLQRLTAEAPVCTVSTDPLFVETCGAAIMRPKSGEFWAVWGLPSHNEYERFEV